MGCPETESPRSLAQVNELVVCDSSSFLVQRKACLFFGCVLLRRGEGSHDVSSENEQLASFAMMEVDALASKRIPKRARIYSRHAAVSCSRTNPQHYHVASTLSTLYLPPVRLLYPSPSRYVPPACTHATTIRFPRPNNYNKPLLYIRFCA